MPEGLNLFTGLADYVRRCKPPCPLACLGRMHILIFAGQTFEGGISAKPDAEAHGAYAFCALGCLAILDAPHRIFPRFVCIILPIHVARTLHESLCTNTSNQVPRLTTPYLLALIASVCPRGWF